MPETPQIPQNPVGQAFWQSLSRTKTLLLFMGKIILPFFVLTEIMLRSGALDYISQYMRPVMAIWRLPPEAAMVMASGMLINLYAAVAVAAPLGLGWQEVTVLGLMLGIAHALPMETAIIRELTPRWKSLNLLRLAAGLAAGWLLALVLL